MSKKKKSSIFDSALLKTKVTSVKPKLFPEALLGYFMAPTLALIANSFLASYFNKYLTDIYGITSWASVFNTLLPIISVIFVVLGNIIVGRLMDKNKSRAGKARPLLLLSLPVSVLAILTLFYFTPFADVNSSQTVQIVSLILIAVGYNLWFAIAYPLYFTPHSALVNLSTRSGKDRSLLATLSNSCNLGAMGMCTMIIPFFLGLLFKYDMNPGEGAIPVMDNGVVQYYTDANGGILYDTASSLTAWKVFSIALIVITVLGVIVEYYFTRERVTEETLALKVKPTKDDEEVKEKTITVKEQLKICRKDKFWIIIIIFFFLFQLGGMVKNVSQLYFCTAWFPDSLGNYTTVSGGNFSGTLAIIGAVPTAMGMVIAWPLSNKIGKGKAILFGAIVATLGGALGFLTPFVAPEARFPIIVASFVIKALGSTPAMYLSIALLGDIMDHQEALYGKRTDGLSMTLYGAIMAGMTGISTGILNLALSISGYTPEHPETTQTSMLWVFVGVETFCYLLIFLLFIFMNVEKYSKFDHEAIVEFQKQRCKRLGIEYVAPEDRMKAEQEKADEEAEVARVKELKALCKKKGLSYEEEEAKYQTTIREKEEKAALKQKAAEEKKEAKKKAQEEKLANLTPAQKEALERKEAHRKEYEDKVKVEFDALLEKTRLEREEVLG